MTEKTLDSGAPIWICDLCGERILFGGDRKMYFNMNTETGEVTDSQTYCPRCDEVQRKHWKEEE